MGKLQVHKIVNSFFSSNSYILFQQGSFDVWLIDCGDVEPIIKWCGQNGMSVRGVFLTHTHFDHIYGLNELLEHNPQLEVYTSCNGGVALTSPRYNLSQFHDESFIYKGDATLIQEKETVDLFVDEKLMVYETPGHDWSCLTYKVDDFLFTGDSYIPGVKLVTNFPKSHKNQAKESLDRIMQLNEYVSYICPGHGEILKLEK